MLPGGLVLGRRLYIRRKVRLRDRGSFLGGDLGLGGLRRFSGSGGLLGSVQKPVSYTHLIMTRGHQADYEVLAQVLRSGAKYLGCIGSKRKLALCKERLLDAGFTEAEYARLHAPIGLAIGAQTPEEIAVSVAAELIAVRAGVQP